MPSGACINRTYHEQERLEAKQMELAEDEWKRVDRWHATYNAALTGFLAFSGNETMNSMSLEEAIRSAKSAANQTHGELK